MGETLRTLLRQLGPAVWELPPEAQPGMRVPGRLYATRRLVDALDEGVLQQLAAVCGLPGVVERALCMPDGHWGYGFPIGGVAAMDPEAGGVISPGGIGFDINCGMRLVRTELSRAEVEPRIGALVDALFARIPAGVGPAGGIRIDEKQLRAVLREGSEWCVANGYGWPEDLEFTEEGGRMHGADDRAVSARALERGRGQLGTLGSGNHYLEIQVLAPEDVADAQAASAFGLFPGQVVVMYHTGSRGLGHQIATDYIRTLSQAMGPRYGLHAESRELACAPFHSPDGQAYFAAQLCAVNMAFANRQVLLHRIRAVFAEVFGRDPRALGLQVVYDVAHNVARLEPHESQGQRRELLVHRKGATRALPAGAAQLPAAYRPVGQPVIIGGSMETGSYLLVGTAGAAAAWASTAHGSGRSLSRHQATRRWNGRELQQELGRRGIYVRSASPRALAEEAGGAYKDIDAVVEAAELAGLSRRVARFRPLGNVKG